MIEKRAGRLPEAIENFRRAQDLGYEPLDCQLQILDAELSRKNWLEVFALSAGAERSEAEAPTAAMILNLRAVALEEAGFEEDAVMCLERAATLRPFEPWCFRETWPPATSIAEALGNFLELYDLSPSLNYNLAQVYNSMNNWQEALRYGLRSIELQNNSRDAHDLVGKILFKAGDFEDSVTFYRLAVILAPKDALGYYNLGCAYRGLKDEAEAEKYWLLAVKYDKAPAAKRASLERRQPRDSAVRPPRTGNLSVAVQVRAEPVSYDAHFSLGVLYIEQQKKETALDAFAGASEVMPLRQDPYFEMGAEYSLN